MKQEMNERRMLELAAKAAGIAIVPCSCSNPRWPFKHDEAKSGEHGHWNPLVNDGDALRLAVALRISIMLAETDPCTPDCAYAEALPGGPVWRYVSAKDDDPGAATRRAIVRAAAAIGEAMQ